MAHLPTTAQAGAPKAPAATNPPEAEPARPPEEPEVPKISPNTEADEISWSVETKALVAVAVTAIAVLAGLIFIPKRGPSPDYGFTPPPTVATEPQAAVPPPAVKEPTPDELTRQADAFFERKQYAEALPLYQKAADQGYAGAQFNLGLAYTEGWGVPRNYAQAVHWYRKAADQGHVSAQLNLWRMYAEGHGVTQNYAKAIGWVRKAAEKGSVEAQVNLGIMYFNGMGEEINDAQAIKWFQKAAEQGHATAQNALGAMYAEGRGAPQNEALALNWYGKAADQGYAIAQNNLGVMYEEGRGAPQNHALAFKWYQNAANQGYAVAQNNLGRMFANGQGTLRNEVKAVQWYQKAAEQGYVVAKINLGVLKKMPGDIDDYLIDIEGDANYDLAFNSAPALLPKDGDYGEWLEEYNMLWQFYEDSVFSFQLEGGVLTYPSNACYFSLALEPRDGHYIARKIFVDGLACPSSFHKQKLGAIIAKINILPPDKPIPGFAFLSLLKGKNSDIFDKEYFLLNIEEED